MHESFIGQIDEAERFCIEAHKGQKRKYSGEPYSQHPIMVANIIKNLQYHNPKISDNLIIAGYLHDVLEDTDVSEEMLKRKFGVDAVKLVKEVTDTNKIKTRDGLVLKFADMISNICTIPVGVEDDDGLNDYLLKRIDYMNMMQRHLKDEPTLKELVDETD